MREIAARASFAVGDTRAPVRTAVLGMVVNVTGDLTLGRAYGVVGLAASTTGSLVVSCLALLWLVHRRHGLVPGGSLAPRAVRSTIATTAAALAVLAVRSATSFGADGLDPFAEITVVVAACLGTYLLGLIVLRGPEPGELRELTLRVARGGR